MARNKNCSSILYTYMDCKIPDVPISVALIEKMCVERLKLYSLLVSLNHSDTLEELKKKLGSECPFLNMFQDDYKYIRNDSIYIDRVSHFVLRFCYAFKHARTFVDFEAKWLKIRFKHASLEEKQHFLIANCQYPRDEDDLYVIPFQKALYPVSNRKCCVKLGLAYVAEDDLFDVVCQDFRTKLLNHLEEETISNFRNTPSNFRKMIMSLKLVTPYTSTVERQLNFKKLDEISQFFPLCMKHQFEHLRKNHHLGHFSRFELGVFLKDIGLSLEDTLTLFEEEFTIKNSWTDKLNYYFRHLYGKIGANKSGYNSESCDTIIKKSDFYKQVNGCPFSKWGTEALKKRLREETFNKDDIDKILKSVENKNFQEACGIYSGTSQPTSHPVKYFNDSDLIADNLCDIEDIYYKV